MYIWLTAVLYMYIELGYIETQLILYCSVVTLQS